jgi:hypothetical protein
MDSATRPARRTTDSVADYCRRQGSAYSHPGQAMARKLWLLTEWQTESELEIRTPRSWALDKSTVGPAFSKHRT